MFPCWCHKCLLFAKIRVIRGPLLLFLGSTGGPDFPAQVFCLRAAAFGFNHAGFEPLRSLGLPAAFAGCFRQGGEFFLPSGFGQFFGEADAGERAVLGLGAGIRGRDDEPGRDVLERDGGRNLVDMLAAGPAGPVKNLDNILISEPDHANEFHAEFEFPQGL